MAEAVWPPIKLALRLEDEEAARVLIARRTLSAACLAFLSDPTSIAQVRRDHNLPRLSARFTSDGGHSSRADSSGLLP
jgi:uncharacterized heparinase superfamily protein